MIWIIGLGIFNILWALVLCFLFLVSQFSFVSGAIFGLFCFISGIGILNRNKIIRKFFLRVVPVLGLLSVLNLIPLTGQHVQSGFHMNISDIMLFSGIYIIFPIFVNFIVLTHPKIKEQFVTN